jgi:hypothetical protein
VLFNNLFMELKSTLPRPIYQNKAKSIDFEAETMKSFPLFCFASEARGITRHGRRREENFSESLTISRWRKKQKSSRAR